MAEPESASHRRDLVRAALLSGAIVAFLLGAAAAGVYNKELRAFYYADRIVRAKREDISHWADRLGALGPEGASAWQWVYRRISNPNLKEEAAFALGEYAGLLALHDLVEREGIDTPAEEALVQLLYETGGVPPPEAEITFEDDSPPPDDVEVVLAGGFKKIALAYRLGNYEVEVRGHWLRDVGISSCGHGRGAVSWGPWRQGGCGVRVFRLAADEEKAPLGFGKEEEIYIPAGSVL